MGGLGCFNEPGCSASCHMDCALNPNPLDNGWWAGCCDYGIKPIRYKDQTPKDPHASAIMMDHANAGRTKLHFTWPYSAERTSRDAHESFDDDPAGENVMFMDGRVEWLDWKRKRSPFGPGPPFLKYGVGLAGYWHRDDNGTRLYW